MNNELKRQERVLDAVTDHTDCSAYELQNVSQQAKKDFKVRPGAHWGFDVIQRSHQEHVLLLTSSLEHFTVASAACKCQVYLQILLLEI